MEWPDPKAAIRSPVLVGSAVAWIFFMLFIGTAILTGPSGAPPVVAAPTQTPTKITVATPKSGTIVTTPTITMAGTGPPGASVTIGAVLVPQTNIEKDGTWRTQITIPAGKDNYQVVGRLGSAITSTSVIVTLKPAGP